MKELKLAVVYGTYDGDSEQTTLFKVYREGEGIDMYQILGEYFLEDCDMVDVNDYYCNCADTDCEYCSDPDSEEAYDYAKRSALDYVRDQIYGADWYTINVPGYDIKVLPNGGSKLRGVPTWDE